MCAVNVRSEWMFLNQLHCPRDLAGNEWECEVLLTHASRVWFEQRCLLNAPEGNFLLIDLQLSILMEKKPSVKEVVFSLNQKSLLCFPFWTWWGGGEGGYHLLWSAKGLQRPKFAGDECFRVGMGFGKRSFLTYTISNDSEEPGGQKLSLMTEQLQRADQVFSPHSLEPGAGNPTCVHGQGTSFECPVYCTGCWGFTWVIDVNTIWGSL